MQKRLLYLVRHGETDWNAAARWQGHTDVPLNATGREQARDLGRALRTIGLAGVVASNLSRARETASIMAEELGLEIAYFDAGLRERSFGCFEGLTRAECHLKHPEAWRAWVDERRPPAGAETQEALAIRVVAAVGRAAEQAAGGDGPALVVTHGGAMRAIVSVATGEVPAPIKNAGVWRVTWKGGLAGAEELIV